MKRLVFAGLSIACVILLAGCNNTTASGTQDSNTAQVYSSATGSVIMGLDNQPLVTPSELLKQSPSPTQFMVSK